MTFRSLITLVALAWVVSNFLTYFKNGGNHSWREYFKNSVIKTWSKTCSSCSSVIFFALTQWHIFYICFHVIWTCYFGVVLFGFFFTLGINLNVCLIVMLFWIPSADKDWTMSRSELSWIIVNTEVYPWFYVLFQCHNSFSRNGLS